MAWLPWRWRSGTKGQTFPRANFGSFPILSPAIGPCCPTHPVGRNESIDYLQLIDDEEDGDLSIRTLRS
jgi:hypothetical protein